MLKLVSFPLKALIPANWWMLLLLFVCLACSTPSNCNSCNATNTCQICTGAYAYDPSTNMCARTFIHESRQNNSIKEKVNYCFIMVLIETSAKGRWWGGVYWWRVINMNRIDETNLLHIYGPDVASTNIAGPTNIHQDQTNKSGITLRRMPSARPRGRE